MAKENFFKEKVRMTLEIIINQIFILFGMLALGVLAYKFHMVDENANEALSSLLLKVTMPCTLIAAGCVDTYGVRTMELVKMTVVFIGYYVLALLLNKFTKLTLSKSYFMTDAIVLALSLTYIPAGRIVFSFITVTLSSFLIERIQRIGAPCAAAEQGA